ncbi:transposase [Agrobacterium salinitolerans]|nr:transposase [Agrobacterium salinitolerans]
MAHLKAYRLKLYPNKAQASVLARHAGTCRWLWNHLLAMQKARHAADGTFVFFHDMSKMLPGFKKDHPWLSDAPSNSLVRVCRNLDLALKKCFKEGAGFPRFKARGTARESFYVSNHVLGINEDLRRAVLPKTGSVGFRAGRLPQGRIAGANVAWNGKAWELTVQCETAATNLRRFGLTALGLDKIDVGQAMPERAVERLAADACGEASGGREAQATLSHASRKQETEPRSTELSV